MPGQRPAHLGLDVVKPTTDDGPRRPLISRWVIRISWRPEAWKLERRPAGELAAAGQEPRL